MPKSKTVGKRILSGKHNAKRNIQNNRNQPEAPARLETPAAPSLSFGLPVISGDIPKKISIFRDESALAQIAVNCIDAGVIETADISKHMDISGMLNHAVNRLVEECSGGLKHMSPVVHVSNSLDELIGFNHSKETSSEVFGFSTDLPQIAASVIFNCWDGLFLQDKIVELENAVKGLGETALHHLYRSLNTDTFSITPSFCAEIAREYYWGGWDDESQTIEEYGSEAEDVYSIKDLDESFPKWVREPKEVLAISEIESLTAHENGLVSQVASLLVEMHNQDSANFWLPQNLCDDGGDFIAPAVLLRWNKDDDTQQIADDYGSYVQSGDYSFEEVAVWAVENTVEGCGQMFANIRQYFKRLGLIEKLLNLVTTEPDGDIWA